jgi:hypothetical protein
MRFRSLSLVVAMVLVAPAVMLADVLVLRDGRRVEGTLVSVRGDTIEFDGSSGRERGVHRYDRSDIRSIQFDEAREGSGFGGGAAARPGLRERVIAVDARVRWNDTGIDVRGGQDVSFVAVGKVTWGPSRRDEAEGEHNSPSNPGRPMPNRNAAALIGKVGDSDPFFIGNDRGPIRVRGGGRLYLGINDDFLQDNGGSFRVTIYY